MKAFFYGADARRQLKCSFVQRGLESIRPSAEVGSISKTRNIYCMDQETIPLGMSFDLTLMIAMGGGRHVLPAFNIQECANTGMMGETEML
ncbi:hypothetical protein F9C07_551 [Aspergillus flavus]|uniref:Uncharacterized protein n=1 Tax=Aspergillus flavus (strain ATCC 200026 / FGSC A1120 / IAM 13836 / NRRL 3357 / JCM 12722 / SRRC 167) TaxID=332952 RepID=A0A7U2QWN7_ASPFN|nr:hypothetical protein F9C07_551 [Aspergillus flavus]